MKSHITTLVPQRHKYSLEGMKFSPDPLLHAKVETVLRTVDNGARRPVLELKDENKRVLGQACSL